MRLRCTTRDWLWLCLVLALVIGWAVRPSKERGELRTALEMAHHYNDVLSHENKALRAIVNSPLSEQEKRDIGKQLITSGDAEVVTFLKRYEQVLRDKYARESLAQ